MDKEEVYRILNQAYFSDHPHEAKSLPDMSRMLQSARLFMDVGASLGQFTRLATRSMTQGEVIAVEADPIRHEELARNAQRWMSESSVRIEVVHAAATAQAGSIRFQTTRSNVSGGIVRHSVGKEVRWDETEVPGMTLDSICAGRVPDLVKMDIEGAEHDALRGATALLKCKKTKWVIEVHTFPELGGPKNASRVNQLMADFGYGKIPFHGKTLYFPKGSLSLGTQLRLRFKWLTGGLARRMSSL
jgi:FkbM family methyltransferase